MPFAPIYSYLSLGECQQQLANRLYDSTMQFWSPAELTVYIREALRTWNAMTNYWRGDFILTTVPAVTVTFRGTWNNASIYQLHNLVSYLGILYVSTVNFNFNNNPATSSDWVLYSKFSVIYDITSLSTAPTSLRPLTVLDTELYQSIQYSLLEPATGVNPWIGASLQFSASDLIESTNRRMNEILSITGCTITQIIVPAVYGQITLPDTTLDVRRMAYFPAVGQPSTMWQDDTWAEQSFNVNFTLKPAGTPLIYRLSTEPPISFDTDVPPNYAGYYQTLVVQSGPVLNATTPNIIPIPDDWTPILKWGVLADLFSRDTNAQDIPRAQYCEMRYRMGIAILASTPAILAARYQNLPLQIDSMREADLYNVSWQSAAPSTPTTLLAAGLNLIAFSPAANSTLTPAQLTVVTNAPVPVNSADLIQVGRDDIDVIIDYAQHLAALKMGGEEFAKTMPLFQRFLKQTSIYNAKLKEMGEFTVALQDRSQREEEMNPRLATSVSDAQNG